MMILVVGTPDSGKSLLAENISEELSADNQKYYIATMIPFGEDGKRRVERHRKMREGKGFITLEWPVDVATEMVKLCASDSLEMCEATLLLECMSNLIGNEMHRDGMESQGDMQIINKVVSDVDFLNSKAGNLVVVTNDFPREDDGYDDDTIRYVNLVSMINKELMAISDVTYCSIDGKWQRYEAD